MTAATHAHPTPKFYWMVAAVLAAITAVEVAVTYISFLDPVIAPILIIMSLMKFGAVVAFFMHLRFDKPLYRGFFIIGMIGAVAIFLVMLLTFRAL